MNIDMKGLIDFVTSVDIDECSPLPSVPVPRPQNFLFDKPQQVLQRKALPKMRYFRMTNEQSSEEGGCNEEEEQDGEMICEDIPGYLPPLPKILKDEKGYL